jgi:uncharacterized membrane protein YcaP (DUF421 family)
MGNGGRCRREKRAMLDLLDTIFGTTNDVNAAQETARAVVVFVYGLLLVRVVGRRAFSKWSAVNIVVSVIVGSNLSRTLTGGAPLGGTLLATSVLMAIHFVLARSSSRSERVSRWVEGRALPLTREGRLQCDTLHQHNVSDADLAEALHTAGLDSLDDARALILEPSGKISVLKRR